MATFADDLTPNCSCSGPSSAARRRPKPHYSTIAEIAKERVRRLMAVLLYPGEEVHVVRGCATPSAVKSEVEIVFRKAALVFMLALFAARPAFAQTQDEMNRQVCGSYDAADRRMSGIYASILKEYASDLEFIKNLKASQRAWLAYRDTEMKAIYPDREPGYYGTIHEVCECNELKALTESRIKELQGWVRGADEYDACKGSVHVKRR